MSYMLSNLLKKLRRPPVFDDQQKTLRAEILHHISIIFFFGSLVFIVSNLLFGSEQEKSLNWVLGLIAFGQLLILWMIRSGHVNQASLFGLTTTWIILTAISHDLGGIRDVAIFGYMPVILIAGILLGWRYAVLYTLASIIATWWLAALETSGALLSLFGTPYRIALDLTVVFILFLQIMYFMLKALTNALIKAQHEISERKRAQKELYKLARTDSLTDLPNRRHFFEIAEKEFAAANRYNRDLSLIILDIDRFKDVNDTYGHLVGDRAFMHMADLLRESIRASDTPARFGGDEIVVLLPETDARAALALADRFRQFVEDTPFEYRHNLVYLTTSIGIGSKGTQIDLDDFDLLLAKADQAMYKAKRAGGNQIFCYDMEKENVPPKNLSKKSAQARVPAGEGSSMGSGQAASWSNSRTDSKY